MQAPDADDQPPSLDALKQRIAASRQAKEAREAPRTPKVLKGGNSYGYIADLFSGFAVGTGLGYVLDREFDSLPLFTVTGLLLGSASGVLMIYKASLRSSEASESASENETGESTKKREVGLDKSGEIS